MKEGKPEAYWEAVAMGLISGEGHLSDISPPNAFLKIWNDDGWFLPEQLKKSKKEMDKLVEKGHYQKVIISLFHQTSIRHSCRRAIYKLTKAP